MSHRRRKPLIPQRNVGKISMKGYTSSVKMVSSKELEQFVKDEIQEGPQIVSLPVPPYRHAFLVDVQSKDIRIADWNGGKILQKVRFLPEWQQYLHFLRLVQEKYPRRPLSYYPVDPDLYKSARLHEQVMGGGGCSFYLFAWIADAPEYQSWAI